jgi:uncharacterized repeat protein (TIGR03806 family)
MDTPDGGTAYDLAFPPDFAQSGFVYIGWNGPGKGTKKSKFSRITRYTFDAKRQTLDPQSGKTIIQWESDGHNGAALCFGKDGMLYVTSGDGTSDSDTDLMGQRPDTLLAKVLRIDVNGVSPGKQYRVPADNPYVDDARFAPETWAYGLRNPWRITSDPVSGQIWVGNNGQDLWEQAYLVRKGENYGWSVQEGGHPFAPTRSTGPTPIVKPTVEHHHSEFRSLTGGIVYRGQRHKDLVGAYIYGDHSTGSIWGIRHDGTKILWHKELAESTLKITGFTVDADGELLILHHAPEGQGGFFTLEPSPVVREANPFPRTLSASGLFTEVARHEMKPGVVPYSVNAPFWSDGLHKQRWIAIPGTERIEYRRTRGWNFPERTVIIKSFALEQIEGDPKSRKWIETRFLTKQQGEWRGYSYIWNDTGTDATLVSSRGMDQEYEVKTRTGVRKQTWHFPSRAECMVCHSRAANFVLGLCTVQMNRQEHDQNQMVALDQAGYLQVDWPGELRQFVVEQGRSQGLAGKALDDFVREHLPQPGQRTASPEVIADLLPKLVNPSEARHDLTARAKSWLHSNCASCHIEAGGGNAQMDLEYTTPLEKMRILNVKPIHQALSLPEGLLVMPGQPEKSLLLRRAEIRGAHQMPPIGSNRVDPLGSELLREWIKQLK